jgi:hypothetical protein
MSTRNEASQTVFIFEFRDGRIPIGAMHSSHPSGGRSGSSRSETHPHQGF